MQIAVKQPADIAQIIVTFALADVNGGVAVSVFARGLVPGAPALTAISDGVVAANSTDVKIRIGGGGAGERYLVTVTATDDAGLVEEQEAEIAVLALEWVMPGGGAPWLTVAEFVGRFGLEETVRMTNVRGDGRIDGAYLIAALIDAQAVAEAYISGRYAVDASGGSVNVPTLLKSIIADLARMRLYPQGAPEGIDVAAKAAMRNLDKIQSGMLTLGPQAAPSSQPVDAPVRFRAGQATYANRLNEY